MCRTVNGVQERRKCDVRYMPYGNYFTRPRLVSYEKSETYDYCFVTVVFFFRGAYEWPPLTLMPQVVGWQVYLPVLNRYHTICVKALSLRLFSEKVHC